MLRRPSLAGLQLPRTDDGVFDRLGVPVLEVSDDHHVLGEASGHGERLGERSDEEIPRVEGRADDDVAAIELPGDQAAVVAPIEQSVAAALRDAVEPSGQRAEIGEQHRMHASKTSGTWKRAPRLVALQAIVRPTREES